LLVALAFALGSCRASSRAPSSSPASAPASESARARPSPGAELDGPPPPPTRTPSHRARAAAPLDFGRDRPAVAIAVPQPPEGGAAAFQFADERRGWVMRVPGGSRQLPAVAYGDGRVYVSAGFESYELYALDAEDGHVVWAATQLEDNGPTAPTYEDGHVIFNTESCTLFCLDAKTGRKLWHKNLGDPTLSQPAVADGLVFAAHPAAEGPAFSAYRVKNGDEVWTRTVGGELLAAPVIDGDSIYVATIEGRLFRFVRKSGQKLWARDVGATTAPWIAGGEVFVSRRVHGREAPAVLAADSGRLLRVQTTVDAPYLGDVPASLENWKKVWAFEGSRPVVMGGVRYAAMGGDLEASDPATGERLWLRHFAAGVNARSLGTPALAGAALVVSSRAGDVFGVDVDTGYTLFAYQLGHRVTAEPIVARGWIYTATTDGRVVALNVADPTLDGWHMFGGNAKHNGAVD
jgi:Ca-activated chloride channel family protein